MVKEWLERPWGRVLVWICIVAESAEREDGSSEEVARHVFVAKEDLAEDAEFVLDATTKVPPRRRGENQKQRQAEHGRLDIHMGFDKIKRWTQLINDAAHHGDERKREAGGDVTAGEVEKRLGRWERERAT